MELKERGEGEAPEGWWGVGTGYLG